MLNIVGALAVAYLACTGTVTNASMVGRGLVRAGRKALAGDVRGASVETLAAVAAPTVLAYRSTRMLAEEVVESALELTGIVTPAPEDPWTVRGNFVS